MDFQSSTFECRRLVQGIVCEFRRGAVQRANRLLRSDRPSFVIAHRLSTIRDAALILGIKAGQIVEPGNHASLLGADGADAWLYEAQLATPLAEAQAFGRASAVIT